MSENERGPHDYVDWERMRADEGFQNMVLGELRDRFLLQKFPNYLKLRQPDFTKGQPVPPAVTDEMREQNAFKQRMKALRTVEEYRQFCAENGLEFPSEEALAQIERDCLVVYNEIDDRQAKLNRGSKKPGKVN